MEAAHDTAFADMPLPLLLAFVLLTSSSAQTDTTLHVFSPWAGSIPAQGVTISQTLRGSCTHGSEVLTRFDAWHCSVGGRVYDPCFANTRVDAGAHVLCMNSPWEDATAIELKQRLPIGLANPSGDPRRFPPWAMLTAAHEECELATGSLGRIAGLRVDYACAGSGLLLGLPTRGRTWTQPYAASSTAKAYRRVPLLSIWW